MGTSVCTTIVVEGPKCNIDTLKDVLHPLAFLILFFSEHTSSATMYHSPWGNGPFDLPTYLARGTKTKRSFPVPFSPPPPATPYGMMPRSDLKSFHPKSPKLSRYARFSNLETPSSSDFSSSDWDDAYALDTDSELDHIPGFPFSSRQRYASRDLHSRPDISRISLTMLRPMAQDVRLRSDEVLFLPPLVHLRILMLLPGGREELRIAVPGSVAFEHVTKQLVQCYAGKGVPYTAQVEQRGRMCGPPQDAALEDLAHRGEVYRGGRRELQVEIVVGGDEGWGIRDRFGGRGPSAAGDAEVETVRKREVSRTRYTKAKR